MLHLAGEEYTMGLASINERDSELIEVLEAAQACLFLFF
jgi:hypothetical protein